MRTGLTLFVAAVVASAFGTTSEAAAPVHAVAATQPTPNIPYCGANPVSYSFNANDGWPMGFVWPATSGTLRCAQATSDSAPAGLEVVVMCGFNTTGSSQLQLSVVEKLPTPIWSGILEVNCPTGAQSIIVGAVNKYATAASPITVWYNFHFEASNDAEKMLY